jgi:hypothetical protein
MATTSNFYYPGSGVLSPYAPYAASKIMAIAIGPACVGVRDRSCETNGICSKRHNQRGQASKVRRAS